MNLREHNGHRLLWPWLWPTSLAAWSEKATCGYLGTSWAPLGHLLGRQVRQGWPKLSPTARAGAAASAKLVDYGGYNSPGHDVHTFWRHLSCEYRDPRNLQCVALTQAGIRQAPKSRSTSA